METPLEKGQLGPQPSEKHLPNDRAGGTGGDGAGTGPKQPPPSRTSRVSFSSRLQVQQPQSPAPGARGDKPSRHSRRQQGSRSRPSSAVRGQRSAVRSPVPLPPPSNTAARQCRRLRTCAACSGKTTPDTCSTVTSTPSIPALSDIEPLLVHQLTQTEPDTPEHSDAAERVDRDIQTESPGRERRKRPVRLFMDRETQTQPSALPPSAAPAARGAPEPPRRRQRLSLFRRLLRACRCSYTRTQPEQPGPKTPQHPQGAAQGHTTGIGVFMVIQEAPQSMEWSPYSSWPWLVETSL